jgi:hypothetical protein
VTGSYTLYFIIMAVSCVVMIALGAVLEKLAVRDREYAPEEPRFAAPAME